MPLELNRRSKLALLAAAMLVLAPAVDARPQPAGPSAVDQTLLPYASTADSVKLPDGRMLHFVCMGKGSPTVILTAGMGDFSAVAWSNIQPDMARLTRVCAWDRPGFGLSDGSAAPETVATTTADLEAALASGKIPGPYVMVGHSLGSYETLLYTDRHPEKVVGMIMVDGAIPDQIALYTQLRPNEPAPDPAADPMVRLFHKCADDIRAGTAKANGPDPDHCFAYPPNWPQALREALAAKVDSPVQYEAMASFGASFAVDSKQVMNPSRNYRDIPLIVLTSTLDPPPPPGVALPPLTEQQKAQKAAMDAIWNRGHDELAALSTRGVNARVPGADHYIQRSKPQVVLDAVAQVLAESAGNVPVAAKARTSSVQSEESTQSSVAVPREVLERYVGRYALNGTVATVSLTDDGQLTVQLEGQPPGPPLRAVSANEFVADAAGVRLIFEGEGPKATRVRSQYQGSEVVGTRIADGAATAPPGPGRAPTTLDAAARKQVVGALGTALRQRYVFPDVGGKAASRIDAALAAGEYDRLSDPAAFAARLDADVSAVAHDKHMRVISMGGPPPGPPPGAMGPLSAEGGVVRADRLSGGVGYVEVIGFPPLPAFKPVIDRAMTALKGSTALIIDDRRNGGGDPAAVAYAVSFLVPPDRHLHINDIVSRTAGTTDFTRQGTDSQPTPVSFAGIPIYVLTSHATFSGGEEFAYDVKTHRLGTIVGEVTGGGANPTGPVPLGDGLMAAIPFGRPENPVTKTNWEGRGVQPDVAVPAAVALKATLETLGQESSADIAAASRQQVFAP